MAKLLHIADLHLGFEHRYLGPKAAARAAEGIATLERIAEFALDPINDIAGILFAGDLFETHVPDRRLVGQVVAILGRLHSAGKVLVTVPGNHDEYTYPESVYRQNGASWPGILVTNPTPAKVTEIDLGNAVCEVYSMAFTGSLSSPSLPGIQADAAPSANTPRVRVALLHGTLDANPSDRTYRIDTATLREADIAYAALGHIHKPRETRLGEGLAVYPGTLMGKGFDDPGVSQLTLVSFPGGRARVEQVAFPTRRIETRPIDLARHSSFDGLLSHLTEQSDPELIMRLELRGARPEDFDEAHLLGRLQGAFYHLELDDRSIVIPDSELESLAQQPTVRGVFVRLMQERIRAAEKKGDEPGRQRAILALRRGLTAFESTRVGGETTVDTNQEPVCSE